MASSSASTLATTLAAISSRAKIQLMSKRCLEVMNSFSTARASQASMVSLTEGASNSEMVISRSYMALLFMTRTYLFVTKSRLLAVFQARHPVPSALRSEEYRERPENDCQDKLPQIGR